MNILINASNLKVGGGVQVADSVIRELYKYMRHHFVVVYPDCLADTVKDVSGSDNIEAVRYNLPHSIKCILTGRDRYLDNLVKEMKIEAVLTIFGPSIWSPDVHHLSGFAVPHCVLFDSPFWKLKSPLSRFLLYAKVKIETYLFYRSTKTFFTENKYISDKLEKVLHLDKVYTVTNNHHQVFNNPDNWDNSIILPEFKGRTIVTISANFLHKNLPIIRTAVNHLTGKHPEFRYRFVLTIPDGSFLDLTEEERRHIIFLGPIKIQQCPHLYEQSDVMLLPSLLECFSASYAEAMTMGVPILTTDLAFAHGLCGKAAEYYSPVDGYDMAEKLYQMCNDETKMSHLRQEGKKQLQEFDTAEQRAAKLIGIIESKFGDK